MAALVGFVTANSFSLALVAGLLGAGLWFAGVAVWSIVNAPREEDARVRAERDRSALELQQYTAIRFRFEPRAISEIGNTRASASLWVDIVGEAEAKNCRGRLIALTRIGGERRPTLDVPLSWADPDRPDDPSRKSFHHGALLEVAVASTPNHMIPAWVSRRTVVNPREVHLLRDADLVLGIEIAPEGVAATVVWCRLKWWSSVPIKQDDGTVVHYLLRGDQVEFANADDQSSNAAISSQVHT